MLDFIVEHLHPKIWVGQVYTVIKYLNTSAHWVLNKCSSALLQKMQLVIPQQAKGFVDISSIYFQDKNSECINIEILVEFLYKKVNFSL